MIWLLLALVGAGSFFVTGFNLLTDPLCVSADFGGGRVVQVTCRSDDLGTVTGLQAGLISILIGLGILTLIFWRPLKAIYIQNKLLKIENSDYNFNKVGEVSQKSTMSNEIKKCPKCAEDIKAEAIKCRFCGSDLGPKGSEKTAQLVSAYLKKYLNGNYAFQIMAVSLVALAVVIFGFINISQSREISALKESGQICVENSDGTQKFGCADYPAIKFDICSEYEFLDWYARTGQYTALTDDYSRSLGVKTFSCTNPQYPYLFSLDFSFKEKIMLGELEIVGSAYDSLEGGNYISGGGYVLVAKVSLKTQP